MTLRKKGMLVVILAVTIALVFSLVVSQTIFMRRFDQLEKENTVENVWRVASALYSDFSKISITSGSTLTPNKVVIGGDEQYLKLTIDDSTFFTLGLNFILFVSPGLPVLGFGYDLQTGDPLPIPIGLSIELSREGPLTNPPSGAETAKTGILMLSEGPILVAAYPTVLSINEVVLEGRLVFARYLNAVEVARLSRVTHLPISLYRYDDPEVLDRIRNAKPTGDETVVATYVRVLNSDQVAGYGILTDIHGEPALVLEIVLPRNIHRQGLTSILYLLGAITAIAALAGLLGNYAIEKGWLRRLLYLSNTMSQIRITGDLSQRVEISGNDELTTLAMSINSMLASLEKSRKELLESESQNRALVKGIPDLMYRIKSDGTLLEARSAKMGNILEPHKLLHGKMLYRPLKEYSDLTREVVAGSLKHMDQALKTGEAQIFEFQFSLDGREYFYEVRMIASGKQEELLCVVFDVSQRHEEAKRKEMLIKEVHHRVKNNLQVIASLLYLQSARVDDKKIRAMFDESANRVKSISLIHEKLYRDSLRPQDEEGNVDFREYVTDLSNTLFNSYGVDRKSIRLVLDVGNIFLSLDSAIPCGLIINELVSNSLKHAFPGGSGEIRISLYEGANGRTILIVSDNGIGLPSDKDLENSSSLGLRLVMMLAQQLGAEVHLNRNRGTEFRFTFADEGRKKQVTTGAGQMRPPVGAEVGGG